MHSRFWPNCFTTI